MSEEISTAQMVEDFEYIVRRYSEGNCSDEDVEAVKDKLLSRIDDLESKTE